MINIIEHDKHKAKVFFDPEIEMFRGEILGLAGSADFYASSIDELKSEFKNSLDVYLEVCEERKIEPYKSYNGKIMLRTSSEIHSKLELMASSENISINKLLDSMINRCLKYMGS